MSTIVHAIARSNLFNTDTKHSTCYLLTYDAIMTGRLSYLPKITYLKYRGRSLSSNFGASFTNDIVGGDSQFFISNSKFFGFKQYLNLSSATTNSFYSSMQSIYKFIMTTSSSSTPNLYSICTSDPLLTLYVIVDTNWTSPLKFTDLQIIKVASLLFSQNFICPFSM